MRVIFAYICGGFLLKLRIRRVLFSTLLTQLRLPTESICPAYLHNKHSPQLARPGQARAEKSRAGWLAVCLSLSLSLDQYVHSVLIKCHSPHSSLCITLFSCAKFVSHKCCGKSLVVCKGEGGAGSRGSRVPEWQIAQLSHVFELAQPFDFNPSRINTSCCARSPSLLTPSAAHISLSKCTKCSGIMTLLYICPTVFI